MARTLTGGLCGGLAALAAVQLLELLAQGYATPPTAGLVLAYAGLGALAALCIAAANRLLRGRGARLSLPLTAAATMAVLYAPLVYQRVVPAMQLRGMSLPVSAAAGIVAVAVYSAWIGVLRRLAGRVAAPLPIALGALSAAAVLALDRHLFASVLAPSALATAGSVLLAALAAAAAMGARHPGRMTGAAAAALLLAIYLGGFATAPPAPTAAERRPNLVMIVVDTLRADVFDAVLRETEEGRAFRRAARGAAWFTNAVAVAPWTVPAMGSIMTGLYPAEHGLGSERQLPHSTRTLAERLRGLGYATEKIGTNFNLHPRSGIYRGFDRYVILQDSTWKFPLFRLFEWLHLRAPAQPYQDARAVHRRLRARLHALSTGDRPLFLWLQLMDPHYPLDRRPDLSPDPAAAGLPELDRLYRDAARYALLEVTRMMETLAEFGRWSNTLLVVTSDHGEMLPSDGHRGVARGADGTTKNYGHGHALYDTLLRVPLVIRPPGGLPADREVDALMNQVDLHETLADFLGARGNGGARDSASLAAWLAPKSPPESPQPRAATIARLMLDGVTERALRTDRWKLIEHADGEQRRELYDLAADPGELNDIAAEQPRRLAEATALLEQQWSQLSAPEALPAEPLDGAARERLRALGYLD